MKSRQLVWLALAVVYALTLAACGSGTPDLGVFPAISKIEGDPPFILKAPASDSPAVFVYTSSDIAVATISGNIVTVLAAGSSIITATQPATGKWGSNSTTALLTVSPRQCTAPAIAQRGVCTAPVLSGNYLIYAGRSWTPTLLNTWANANTFCTTTTINGLTGWRLPTDFELSELKKNVDLTVQGWILSKTWSSVKGSITDSRITIDLSSGTPSDILEITGAYFTCMR
jgi:hypothetical protein